MKFHLNFTWSILTWKWYDRNSLINQAEKLGAISVIVSPIHQAIIAAKYLGLEQSKTFLSIQKFTINLGYDGWIKRMNSGWFWDEFEMNWGWDETILWHQWLFSPPRSSERAMPSHEAKPPGFVGQCAVPWLLADAQCCAASLSQMLHV